MSGESTWFHMEPEGILVKWYIWSRDYLVSYMSNLYMIGVKFGLHDSMFFFVLFFFKSNLFKRQWSYFTLDDVSVIQSKSVKNMHFKNLFFFLDRKYRAQLWTRKISLGWIHFFMKIFCLLKLALDVLYYHQFVLYINSVAKNPTVKCCETVSLK